MFKIHVLMVYISYIYIYIRVYSYFNFVISKILDRYMIFLGFIRESSEYFMRLS